jgi:hypothetical protein
MGDEALVPFKKFLYPKLFPWGPGTLQAVASLTQQLGLDGIDYIGVHIRRGDKGDETNGVFASTTAYVTAVQTQCQALNQTTCKVYVATDDPSSIQEMQMQLPGYEVVSQPPLSDPSLYIMRNGWGGADLDSGKKMAGESSFVTDLAMLSKSAAFVGTGSSNVGRFLFFMRSETAPSVSVDESGSFTEHHC